MMRCGFCGAEMRALFTSVECPNGCTSEPWWAGAEVVAVERQAAADGYVVALELTSGRYVFVGASRSELTFGSRTRPGRTIARARW